MDQIVIHLSKKQSVISCWVGTVWNLDQIGNIHIVIDWSKLCFLVGPNSSKFWSKSKLDSFWRYFIFLKFLKKKFIKIMHSSYFFDSLKSKKANIFYRMYLSLKTKILWIFEVGATLNWSKFRPGTLLYTKV